MVCGELQTLAEREAWKLAKEHALDMVAILPNFVLGPAISSRADGTSVGFLKVCLPTCMSHAHISTSSHHPRSCHPYNLWGSLSGTGRNGGL
jgi:hypothetical protein